MDQVFTELERLHTGIDRCKKLALEATNGEMKLELETLAQGLETFAKLLRAAMLRMLLYRKLRSLNF